MLIQLANKINKLYKSKGKIIALDQFYKIKTIL